MARVCAQADESERISCAETNSATPIDVVRDVTLPVSAVDIENGGRSNKLSNNPSQAEKRLRGLVPWAVTFSQATTSNYTDSDNEDSDLDVEMRTVGLRRNVSERKSTVLKKVVHKKFLTPSSNEISDEDRITLNFVRDENQLSKLACPKCFTIGSLRQNGLAGGKVKVICKENSCGRKRTEPSRRASHVYKTTAEHPTGEIGERENGILKIEASKMMSEEGKIDLLKTTMKQWY